MSRPGFKCRASFVAQGGNPVHFFTNLSVDVSDDFVILYEQWAEIK